MNLAKAENLMVSRIKTAARKSGPLTWAAAMVAADCGYDGPTSWKRDRIARFVSEGRLTRSRP
jgi:hypothetical protein